MPALGSPGMKYPAPPCADSGRTMRKQAAATAHAASRSTPHDRRSAMAIIAVRIDSILLMATDTGRHTEHAKRAIRRLGRLFHGAVTFGARQVCYGDVPAMRKKDVRSRSGQLHPAQFLASRGDRTHPF